MNLCLISPPTVTDFEDPAVAESEAIRLIAEHAPVGILSLAAVLDDRGAPPSVFDLNRFYYDYLRSDGLDETPFHAFVAAQLASEPFDIVGLSTICSSYPLTLRLARELKQFHPEAFVILGGPQASVVDVPTLEAFECVDFIVRGEAEETLPLLLEALNDGGAWEHIPGITFRKRGRVVRNPNAPVILDLDALPMPAFHLYPHLADCRYVPLELGRGCPFACKFCSTNDFFRRRFRLKSPQRMLAQMREIRDAYGIATFDLIHDMFTVDSKKVLAFCDALLASGETFYWNCSARTDCISEELISRMADAGCRGIFFGIETGSARLQKLVNKNLDLTEAANMIRCTDEHGIRTAVSLITGFPDETMQDFRETVDFLLDSVRYDHAEPQLHLLAPLAETPIETEYRDQLALDDIYSDMSHQGWRQDPADRELIEAHREIFPNFYAVPTPGLERSFVKEFREFFLTGIYRFRWLLVALHQHGGSLVDPFVQWRSWRNEIPDGELAYRYSQRDIWDEFALFLRTRYVPEAMPENATIATLLEFDAAFGDFTDAQGGDTDEHSGDNGYLPNDAPLVLAAVPSIAERVRLAELGANYKRVLECLRCKEELDGAQRGSVLVAARPRGDGETEIIQLSDLSSELVRLCDGRRTVGDVAMLFGELVTDVDGVAPDKACLFGLELLRQQGVLVAAMAS
jgi:radical SAM superfamily enzyme YgiQ (UPF0313 family)